MAGRPRTLIPPQSQHGADARFGEIGRLVGYDLALPTAGIAAGQALSLTLHWQATGTANRAYTVFVHLLGPDDRPRGFGDAEPAAGRLPTTGWLAGEYLADPHVLRVAADAPAGHYRLAVGLYDPATGQRLPTAAGADQVILGEQILVRGP